MIKTMSKIFLGKVIFTSTVQNLINLSVIEYEKVVECLYEHSTIDNNSDDNIIRKSDFIINDIKIEIITENNFGFISTSIYLKFID